jgi:tetratricopeptide (TPR) repeat protein
MMNKGWWVAITLQVVCAQDAVALLRTQADQALVGQRVVPKFRDFVLRENGEPVEGSGKTIDAYHVERVDGPSVFLKAENQHYSGWAAAGDVVPVSRALDYFSDQIRARPADSFLHAMRAFLWREAEQFEKALRDDDKAIELDPKNPANYCSRGRDWHSLKEYDRAIIDFDQAIRLDPKCALAHVGRGMSRAGKREYSKAIEDLSEAIWLDPLSKCAYQNRGLAWQAKHEYAKAVIDYNMVIRLDPENARAYSKRAGAWAAQQRYDKAKNDYDEAIQLGPRFHEALVERAWLLATCPDPNLRVGKEAAISAVNACELTHWTTADPIEALTAASFAMGEFEAGWNWQVLADILRSASEHGSKAEFRTERDRRRK